MAIIWQRKNPPATDERMAQFEAKEQLVLPESYKVFLRQMNGGVVREGFVPYRDPYQDVFCLTNIFNLSGISRKRHEFKIVFPDTFLPIGGSWTEREQLALEIVTGAIYLWSTEWVIKHAAPDMITFVQEVVCSGPYPEVSDSDI